PFHPRQHTPVETTGRTSQCSTPTAKPERNKKENSSKRMKLHRINSRSTPREELQRTQREEKISRKDAKERQNQFHHRDTEDTKVRISKKTIISKVPLVVPRGRPSKP